jgi:hypothetical protein
LHYTGSTGGFTATVGGQEFYGDDAESELLPTSGFQARIQSEASTVQSITCNYNASTCSAQFKAEHLGMWHTTSQTMGWKIKNVDTGDETGVSVPKSGGTSCANWLTFGPSFKLFCTDKKQSNPHTGSFNGQPCTARASLTTEHQAAYLWTAGVSIGSGPVSITPGTFGENSKTSNATPQDWHDTGCDDPCSTTGGGGVTSRAPSPIEASEGGPSAAEEWVASDLVFTCGSQTGSPGGGAGSPPGGGEPECEWVRYFVIYDDGSWDWLGGWEHECDGDPMLRAPDGLEANGVSAVSSPASSGSPLRARVLGTGPLQSGRAVEIHRLRGEGVHAVLSVDTLHATPADVEAALATVQGVSEIRRHDHVAAIVAPPPAADGMSRASSRGSEVLSSLLRAPEKNRRGARARELEISVERKERRTIGK